ncbi:phage tail tube protein [Actinacidiphila glaucinigra]|uniref:phage tail tube protein n=1 Tax=Actinacidiphila glaucinigra TaxID=235986 RepID=UPI002E37438A|nr:phage tail tube protein [Actinacidiphila glaucinigra]
MAKMVLTSEYLSLNGVDLSAYTKKAEVSVEVEEKDITTYGDAGWKAVIGGLKSGSIAIDFLQDFAAATLDAIMWPLLGTVVSFEVRPTSAAVGTSNPKWTGNVLIKAWNPVSGSVGDEATVGVTFPTSGAVVRATS